MHIHEAHKFFDIIVPMARPEFDEPVPEAFSKWGEETASELTFNDILHSSILQENVTLTIGKPYSISFDELPPELAYPISSIDVLATEIVTKPEDEDYGGGIIIKVNKNYVQFAFQINLRGEDETSAVTTTVNPTSANGYLRFKDGSIVRYSHINLHTEDAEGQKVDISLFRVNSIDKKTNTVDIGMYDRDLYDEDEFYDDENDKKDGHDNLWGNIV